MPGELTKQLQMLRCHVESNAYGFDAAAVRAIHRWENVEPQADTPGAIGTLAGKPVYPLARLLGLDDDAAATQGPVLLLTDYAIQVDKVSRPTAVAHTELRSLPVPARVAHDRVSGLARVEGELTLLLDPTRLVTYQTGSKAAAPAWPADEPWHFGLSTATDKLLCFLPPGQNEETYLAVSYRQAIEVAQNLTLSRLRANPPWLAGLVDWRERAVPVVDVAGLLGLTPAQPPDVSRALIARAPRSGELFAFPATHLAPLPLPLSEDTMVVKSIDPPSPYVRAAYLLTEGYLFLPDLDRLVQ